MQITRFLAGTTATFATIVLAISLASSVLAASGFVGKWQTTSQGKPFTIWLSDDGNAKGDRADDAMSGTWKEEGDTAVITWDPRWVTKITKEGDSYKKSAEKDGKPSGSPSAIEKVE